MNEGPHVRGVGAVPGAQTFVDGLAADGRGMVDLIG